MTNNDDDDDTDETLYVTQFLSLPIAGKSMAATTPRRATSRVIGTAHRHRDRHHGRQPARRHRASKPPATRSRAFAPGANFTFTTGAYPNQLNNIAINGNFAYLPNTGASPNGPVRFDVNTQSLLAVVNRTDESRRRQDHQHAPRGARPDQRRRSCSSRSPGRWRSSTAADEGYVVSAASNIVVKVTVTPATGAPAVRRDPTDATRVLEMPVGKNPRGIVVNSDRHARLRDELRLARRHA